MTLPVSAAPATSVEDDRRAIIDIGSNTVRLVIYEGPARAPIVVYNEKLTARLGKGVAENGRLTAKASATALAALARFALLLRLQGVTDCECVATAAVRDATNGPEFLDQVAALGLSPRLLSGADEAAASARGVLAAFPGARGVVGDLGGGSLELIDVSEDGYRHGVTLPLGTLRLPALRALGPKEFSRKVRRLLAQSGWRGGEGQTFYLVGGSWRALARYAMLREEWPVDDPHGFELAPAAALKLARGLMAMRERTPGSFKGKAGPGRAALEQMGPGISASRLASLPVAAALLAVLIRELKPARLVFSGWGLREGLLANRSDPATAASDPLLAGVTRFAATIASDLPALAIETARWCSRADPTGAAPDSPPARLRLCATMLALASMRTEPNLRAEEGSDWALRKRWIGIDAQGRAMLAATVRANSGRTAIPPELLRMASAARLREAVTWGLAVRLCRRLSVGAAAALGRTALTVEGNRLVLAARADVAVLYTDAVAKDHRLLAECLGLEAKFTEIADGGQLP